jgi:hypothetical protein
MVRPILQPGKTVLVTGTAGGVAWVASLRTLSRSPSCCSHPVRHLVGLCRTRQCNKHSSEICEMLDARQSAVPEGNIQ